MTKTPIGVCISDIHYDLNTLDLADKVTNMAIDLANEKGIPMIIAGDLHNTKANLRSEVVRRQIKTLQRCKIPPIIIIGNHDRDNERAPAHALEYLKPYATIIEKPVRNFIPHWTLIPYHHDVTELRSFLKKLPKGSKLIMHQGVIGTDAGEYIQDRSALTKEDLAGFIVISGHYHKGQHFTLPDNGSFTYIGNPYTLNFGEANDTSKGFLLLYDDGSFEHHSSRLRKHMKLSYATTKPGVITSLTEYSASSIDPDDIVWAVVHGKQEHLNSITKSSFSKLLPVTNFRLELIPTDITSKPSEEISKKSPKELFENMIEVSTGLTKAQKQRLKTLWKDLI